MVQNALEGITGTELASDSVAVLLACVDAVISSANSQVFAAEGGAERRRIRRRLLSDQDIEYSLELYLESTSEVRSTWARVRVRATGLGLGSGSGLGLGREHGHEHARGDHHSRRG